MNQEKQTGSGTETRGSDAKPPAAKQTPGNGAPAAVAPAKIEMDPALLSYSLARDLARVPREEWARIESVACRIGFTRDMAEGVRFVDAVANVINQQGGLFSTPDLNKRHELEECSQQIVDAFRAFILAAVQVARKRGLTNILERYWRLLSAYGPAPKTAAANNGSSKSDAAKPKGDAATAA